MKQEKVQQILVYTDLTPLGNKCLEWGVFFAKEYKKELMIIHVINDNTYQILGKSKTEEKVRDKLESIKKNIENDFNLKCHTYFEEGCTCTILNSVAESHDTFFNIIAVHGKSDLQFMSGQSAVKIIRKSRIPYFVIQKNSSSPSDNRSILLPLDLNKEMKEQTGWVTYLAKNLNAEIDIFVPNIKDDRLKNNLLFCTRFFDKFELKYNKVIAPVKYTGFSNAALSYADNHNSLFMTLMSTKESNLLNYIFGYKETRIISNKRGIPIFIINPKKDLYIPCI